MAMVREKGVAKMFRQPKATFAEMRKMNNEKARLICHETQGVYVITPNPLGGYSIFCNGWKFAERASMCHALDCLQRDAELAVRSSAHA
jgi:hypothetical protein